MVLSCLAATPAVAEVGSIRPPSVPLVVHDPYFSIWCPSEILAEADTQHWTGGPDKIFVNVTIDKKSYRLLGKSRGPKDALPQTKLEVFPTRTRATYEGHGVGVTLTFVTPAIPSDLTLFAEPVTYLKWSAASKDGKKHEVSVEVEASAHVAASDDDQKMKFAEETVGDLTVMSMGTVSQPILARKGDGTQIDWGTFFLAAPKAKLTNISYSGGAKGLGNANEVFANLAFAPVAVGKSPVSGHAVFCYDDVSSIQYFKQNLPAYWRRNGMDGRKLLAKSTKRFAAIEKACADFDQTLLKDLVAAGGAKYGELAALAYRQCYAGSKLAADPNGQPLWFPKENTSNGCIATSDVIYPMSPQALLFGPALTKALLTPIMAYAATERWRFPFAPHDLGTYPQANGQVYGGGERTEENQMPVEESANMLILVAALAKMEGNADYAAGYWKELTEWAEYLKAKGLDPENQLCTDDFLGHLAHNVNLSAKAILGLRSYAELSKMLGKDKVAKEYLAISEEFAKQWIETATFGDHTGLTFDRPGTWSQKYNLIWDRILGFKLFPASVIDREMAWYRKNLNGYGLPLDNRSSGAKLDWSVWTATLTGRRDDFDAIFEGVYRFVHESPQRVGMGDWYDTAKGNFNFMHSRPVVGGVLIPLLYDKSVWTKWASQDKIKVGKYAPIPPAPVIKPLLAAGDTKASIWHYTTTEPAKDWVTEAFNTAAWKQGESGFGTAGTPGAIVRTNWDGKDIWIRREFEITGKVPAGVQLWLHHDDDVEVYVNGVLAYKSGGWTSQYEAFDLLPAAKKALRSGKNTIAIHCHQNAGGQYIDCGLVRVSNPSSR